MDVMTPEERHRTMAAIRGRDTKPELFVRRLLWHMGYRYSVCSRRIPGHADIWMRKYNTAIFVMGCFWHQHPGCRYASVPKSNVGFWHEKFERNRQRDERVRDELAEKGIRQLVIWECTINRMRRDEAVCNDTLASIMLFLESDVQHMEL